MLGRGFLSALTKVIGLVGTVPPSSPLGNAAPPGDMLTNMLSSTDTKIGASSMVGGSMPMAATNMLCSMVAGCCLLPGAGNFKFVSATMTSTSSTVVAKI